VEQLKARTLVTEAIRFWEPLRLAYNLMLLAILLFFINQQGAWALLGAGDFLSNTVILAVMANIAFCLAYLPDLVLRFSLLSDGSKRLGRWIIFAIGMLIGFIFCRFIAEELVRSYNWAL